MAIEKENSLVGTKKIFNYYLPDDTNL